MVCCKPMKENVIKNENSDKCVKCSSWRRTDISD